MKGNKHYGQFNKTHEVKAYKGISDFRKWVTFLPEPVILYSKVDSQKL